MGALWLVLTLVTIHLGQAAAAVMAARWFSFWKRSGRRVAIGAVIAWHLYCPHQEWRCSDMAIGKPIDSYLQQKTLLTSRATMDLLLAPSRSNQSGQQRCRRTSVVTKVRRSTMHIFNG